MDQEERTAGNLELVGGRLCLDFTNTVSTRIELLGREYLSTYQDLLAWGQHVQVLTDDEVEILLQQAVELPGLAADALARAIVGREVIYRICLAMIERQEPKKADLAAMNAMLREALSRLEIAPSTSGFEWVWEVDENDFDRILFSVVRSAADLLTSNEPGRVRQCAREGCDWLFLDLSKNQSRRWCSMNMCGSRVKSRRYYHRRKKQRHAG